LTLPWLKLPPFCLFTPSPRALALTKQQKINSTAHASFSLFGLLFTFVVGCLIALISYLLEPVSKLLYKKWGFKTYAYLEWNTNATLQLQRLAHEELGWDTWSKGTGEIPTTEPGDLLGCLDISNPDHPVLLQPHTRGSSTDEAKTSQSTPQIAIPSFQDQSYQSQESIGDDIHASPVAERPPADPFHSNSTNCKPCLQAQ
jgi:hypothetical protein